MQIAKPPGGFTVQEPTNVRALIESYAKTWPRLPDYWTNIKARLQQTGHREGIPVPRGPAGSRLFIAEGDIAGGLPTVKVAYLVLGDTLYIRMISVG
jgi:hypothetical protein